MKSERQSRRSKHIDTKLRFDYELYVTEEMLADVFTKPFGPLKHKKCCELLGLVGNQ